jgi:hypothetical protein
VSGGLQRHINLSSVEQVRVPILPQGIQRRVGDLVMKGRNEFSRSRKLYFEAEELILAGLKLKGFGTTANLAYESRLSTTTAARRLDAEYFQPVYDSLIEQITSRDAYKIREIERFNSRGIQPEYLEQGEVRVVTSKHLGRMSIEYENLDRTSVDEWKENPNAQIRPHDIVTYTTGAYVGTTNCYMENWKALASNHVNILRIKELNSVYAAVFLNSIAGQMQVRRQVSGSAQVELYSADISGFVIWDAPMKIQERVASLVKNSHEARRRAKTLFEKAKRTVERTIEVYRVN